MKYILAVALIIIFIMSSVPSSAISNGYARIVYNVRGLQDYDLHWNDRFPPGSILEIYAEANGINHRRAVAVDYVFIIKDSNDNIVNTAAYSNRYDDYRDDDFITYSSEIPQSWDDGVYTAEVHIFDLLNDSLMDQYYRDLTSSYINETDRPDLPVMNRSNASNASIAPGQYIQIEKTFYVDKYANKYPVDRFRVENMMLDRTSVAPNETVTVSANVTNTFYDTGSTSLSLLLDNNLIDNATVEVGAYSSKQITFTVSTEVAGVHKIEIVPVGKNTIGLNLASVFNIASANEVEIPTEFYFRDIQIDHLSVEPNQTVTISVTVENRGKEGTQPVDLYINDALEGEQDVHLNFSEIRDVKFNVTKTDLGAYRVTVGNSNLSKVFFVESATVTPTATAAPQLEQKPQLRLVIGLSILVVLILVLRFYLKRKLK